MGNIELYNNMIDDLQLTAYEVIRRKTRDFQSELSDEDLGNYVRGVVDLQTELYGKITKDFNSNNPIYKKEDFKKYVKEEFNKDISFNDDNIPRPENLANGEDLY